MRRTSLAGRTALALAAVAAVAAVVGAAATGWLRSPVGGAALGALAAGMLALWLSRVLTRPWSRVLHAVRDGILSLRDRDFSVSVGHVSDDELGELVAAYNSLGDLLRRERLDLYHRELLLDTVIQTTPLVTVLTNASGRIVYSNLAARQLLQAGRKLEGLDFGSLVSAAPAALQEALGGHGDRLFTMDIEGEPQVYHLSQRQFLLNTQPHRLVLLKQLTRELAAQEVVVWKKVIRVIAHELNNSLAPISSLAHSGQLLARQPATAQAASGDPQPGAAGLPVQLERVFSTIAERAAHLTSFIAGYAQFAKLPRPRIAPVPWQDFVSRLQDTMRFSLTGAVPPGAGRFDASQMEQVMINLLKNAAESGSAAEDITVSLGEHGEGILIEVADRGTGLTDEVLRDALLPFYSTKAAGTGLGLTVCREIVDAHGGRLSLANRTDGGAVVTLWLPTA
jgi:two-component system, NtrC family, nitrogen regulation sensor histidine kinase NtrY